MKLRWYYGTRPTRPTIACNPRDLAHFLERALLLSVMQYQILSL